MDYEAKLSDIIDSLPEIAGGFLFAPGQGLYSNQATDIADDESLQQVGLKLSKIVSMLSVHFQDTNTIRVHFRDLILYGTTLKNGHLLFLLHQPSLSPGMLKMTVQMALNIATDTIEPDIADSIKNSTAAKGTITTAAKDITDTLLTPSSDLNLPLKTIQKHLAYHIGPIAEIIFQESIEKWAANKTPSSDDIPDLINMLGEEIDDKEHRNAFKTCLNNTEEE